MFNLETEMREKEKKSSTDITIRSNYNIREIQSSKNCIILETKQNSVDKYCGFTYTIVDCLKIVILKIEDEKI